MKINHNISLKVKRQNRVRAKVRGTTERPRLNVFRSNKEIYLQVINDEVGKTLASVSSLTLKPKGNKTEVAKQVTVALVEKLQQEKITKLVFDRGSYKYHGRVKTVAEVLREKGLQV